MSVFDYVIDYDKFYNTTENKVGTQVLAAFDNAKITAYFKKESCTSDAFDKTKTKNIKVTLKR